MKENDNEITFIWKIISDNFMKKYKLLLKITFSLTFSLWKTNVNVHWAPPHHLHIWHSSLQLWLWPQLSHVIIAGLVCWYIPRMMGKTVFLGEFASNYRNRFEPATESDNPQFFGPWKMEPSDCFDYFKPKFGHQIVLCMKLSAFGRKMRYVSNLIFQILYQ